MDKVGRLNTVTGSTAFGGVSTYANNPQYRAWGALKSLSYGDGMQMTTSFNNRLQAASYSLTYSNGSMMNRNYQYYADGGFKYMQDVLNPMFDRLQIYDQVGRVSEGKSGAEARGQTATQPLSDSLPYRQSYQYNAFGQMTQRNNTHWGRTEWDNSFNLQYYYDNNNRVGGWGYDADGRVTITGAPDTEGTSTYDASGQIIKLTSFSVSSYPKTQPPSTDVIFQQERTETYRYYEGGGRELKRIEKSCLKPANLIAPCTWSDTIPRYFIRSSVLSNETISEVNSIGKKLKTYIKAAGQTIAWQALTHKHPSGTTDYNPPLEGVYFERYDASGMSRRINNSYGIDGLESDPVENDPLGNSAGIENPYNEEQLAPEGNGACKQCDFNGNFALQESSLRGGMPNKEDADGFGMNSIVARSQENGFSYPDWLTPHLPEFNPWGKAETGGYSPEEWMKAERSFWDARLKELRQQKGPTEADLLCDKELARLFGGSGSVAGSFWEPKTLVNSNGSPRYSSPYDKTKAIDVDRGVAHGPVPDPNPVNDPTNTDRGGIFHLYPNATGSYESNNPGGVYAPEGWEEFSPLNDTNKKTGKKFTNRYGKNNVRFFKNTTTGYVFTIAHSSTKNLIGNSTNQAGSRLVGNFSTTNNGESENGKSYIHVHISFYSKWAGTPSTGERTDPRRIFCKKFGF